VHANQIHLSVSLDVEKYEIRTCRFVGGLFIKRRWVTKRQMKRYYVGDWWVGIGKDLKRSDPDLFVHIAVTLACKEWFDCLHKSHTLACKPPQIRTEITQLQVQTICAKVERWLYVNIQSNWRKWIRVSSAELFVALHTNKGTRM
jgi:hypothetical protein